MYHQPGYRLWHSIGSRSLLPLEAGVPYYRAKKLPDGRERAISELSLRSISQLAGSNETQAAKSKSRRR
jgi:hypothetical protein